MKKISSDYATQHYMRVSFFENSSKHVAKKKTSLLCEFHKIFEYSNSTKAMSKIRKSMYDKLIKYFCSCGLYYDAITVKIFQISLFD